MFTNKIIAGSLLTLTLGGAVAASANSSISDNIKNAVQNRDLEAFKSAKLEKATDRISQITQEDLDKMADKMIQKEAVQNAIQNNDYEAFKVATADSKKASKIDSQEKFDELVAKKQQAEETKSKVDEAVKNNDFEAFKTIVTEAKENRPEPKRTTKRENKPEISDEKLQEKFEKMVAKYNEEGKLPSEGINRKARQVRKNR